MTAPTPHPGKFADLFPPLDPRDLDQLKATMARDGWWDYLPGVMNQAGEIVIGHNRHAIAVELGLAPVFVVKDWTDDECRYKARADNLARRHIDKQTRFAMVKEMLKDCPERSDRQVATDAGVSPTTAGKLRHEMEETGELSTVDSSEGKDGKIRKRPRKAQPKASPKSDPKPVAKVTKAQQKAAHDAAVAEFPQRFLWACDDATNALMVLRERHVALGGGPIPEGPEVEALRRELRSVTGIILDGHDPVLSRDLGKAMGL